MSIVNSNNFLHKTVDGVKQFFSPLINAATVVRENGTRLEQDGKIHADSAEDSTKLGGLDASKYAKMTDVPTNMGGLSMELIWTNKNPAGAFPVQTISVPEADDYDMFLMEVTPANSYYKIQAMYTFVAKGKQLEIAYVYILNNKVNTICRTIESITGGFKFTDSIMNESGASTNGLNLAPQKIYGLRGVPA